jgi:hypothetical protein
LEPDGEDDDPSSWNDEDLLMAIDLGYDEGGSGDTLLVSMQFGIVEQAKKLKRKWRGRLRDAGVEYFHAKDFENFSSGVFAGLDRPQRDQLLRDLSKLIHQHLYIGVTGKITKSVYDQKTSQDFRSRWGTAYTFAVQMLVHVAFHYARRFQLRPEFNILIEDGHRNSAQAQEVLLKTKKEGIRSSDAKLLTIGLGSKPDHPLLQTADMLAYSVWQIISDRSSAISDSLRSSTRYVPEYIDLDGELVDIATDGVERWMEKRKMWGQRKAQPLEQTDEQRI